MAQLLSPFTFHLSPAYRLPPTAYNEFVVTRFGTFAFDPAQRRLLQGRTVVALSPKAFDLLELLLTAAPAVVSKPRIVERLWPNTYVGEGSLYNVVSELRRALGGEGAVRTSPRFGYSLAIPLQRPRADAFYRLRYAAGTFVLGPGENLLGRSDDATVVIDGAGISRIHARVVVDGQTATIEDLGSKNGTFVAGKRVGEPTPLADGDSIHLGDTMLSIEYCCRSATTRTAGS